MPAPSTPPQPLPIEPWWRTWGRTALIGSTIIAAVFIGYEVVERQFLLGRVAPHLLFELHLLRGIGTSVLLGTWAFVSIWRTRQRYEEAFLQAFRALEQQSEARMQALAKNEAFTDRLFHALRDRLRVLDADGRVVKANKVALETMTGEVGGVCQGLGGCRGDQPSCIARRALGGQQAITGQVRTDARTGRIYSIDVYPVPGAELVIEAARDITESKQLEARLRAQEKLAAIGVLSAGIAHDIANPLASMSSELELLENEGDVARLKDSLGVLRGQIARISRTLRDMTAFAHRRADDGSSSGSGGACSRGSVEVAIQDALRMLRHDPRARRIQIDVEVAPGLPELPVQEDQLVMAVMNLIVNAFDAMPAGGRLTIRAGREGGEVVVEVRDDGAGMTPEVKRRALEPLFTTKGEGRGTGLGLTMTHDSVRSWGGTLKLESEPGAGTRVTLRLPVGPEAAHA